MNCVFLFAWPHLLVQICERPLPCVFALDAGPDGAGICVADVPIDFSAELLRKAETRGWNTGLCSQAGDLFAERNQLLLSRVLTQPQRDSVFDSLPLFGLDAVWQDLGLDVCNNHPALTACVPGYPYTLDTPVVWRYVFGLVQEKRVRTILVDCTDWQCISPVLTKLRLLIRYAATSGISVLVFTRNDSNIDRALHYVGVTGQYSNQTDWNSVTPSNVRSLELNQPGIISTPAEIIGSPLLAKPQRAAFHGYAKPAQAGSSSKPSQPAMTLIRFCTTS